MTIGRYDFDKMAFPTGFGESTFIPIGRAGYALRFENAKAIQAVPVPIEDARKFAQQLRRSRSGTLQLVASIAKADVQELNDELKNVVTIRVTEASILLPSGEVLASAKM